MGTGDGDPASIDKETGVGDPDSIDKGKRGNGDKERMKKRDGGLGA